MRIAAKELREGGEGRYIGVVLTPRARISTRMQQHLHALKKA